MVKNLGDEGFRYSSREISGKKLKLVKKKGVYPSEYMDSFKKFGESRLPDTDYFFSSLKNCEITDEQYQRACDVWKVFEIKNLGEYHNLFSACLNDYRLDPCNGYYSSAGFFWDCMLKMTGVKLQKIDNINIHLFLEKGISHRWCFLYFR